MKLPLPGRRWLLVLCVFVLSSLWLLTPTPVLLPPAPAPPASACLVPPLPELSDAEALAFEQGGGSASAVNTGGLTSATARALGRFMRVVRSVGGVLALNSAYRPAAYQAHLRVVWETWMLQLRDNHEPQCQTLRAQVQQEFWRHHLLERQRPVPVSDHTLGIGFDAAVSIPAGARLHRRRVTLDHLARLAGILRPDVFRDPVHFRLIGARASRLRLRARRSA
jgi:hypothetical protein